MNRILSRTRYVVLLGVVANLVVAVMLFVAIVVRAALLIFDLVLHVGDAKAVKAFSIGGIELADLCLIATAFYIVGIGLYELFIGDVNLPDWLVISSLDDLKSKLISLIVVVLGVSFLAQVATWDGKTNLLPFGLALALMILALSVFGALRLGKHSGAANHDANHT